MATILISIARSLEVSLYFTTFGGNIFSEVWQTQPIDPERGPASGQESQFDTCR